MNSTNSFKRRLRAGAGLALVAAATYALSSAFLTGAEPKPKAERKKALTGQELYATHCNRCHAERYPTERTMGQWKTIMLHMRSRGQIPAEDARRILEYIQETK